MLLKNNWNKSEMFSGERRVKLSCSCSSPLMISLTASGKSLAMMRSFLIAAVHLGLGTPPPNSSQAISSGTAPPCPMLWPPSRSLQMRHTWEICKKPYTYGHKENYIIMTSPVDTLSFLGKVLFRGFGSSSPSPRARPSGLWGSTCCAFLYNRRKLNDEVLDHREALRALRAYSLSLIPELSCRVDLTMKKVQSRCALIKTSSCSVCKARGEECIDYIPKHC